MIDILPTGLDIGGISYPIETDYRSMPVFLAACNDLDFTVAEKPGILMKRLYWDDFYEIPQEHMKEAVLRAKWFVDCGQEDDDKKPAREVMDWKQDKPILFPVINKMADMETRAVPYTHWWTFSGYFTRIEEGTFSTILGIRQERAKGKKLEKWEQELYQNNKKLCDVKRQYTEEEQVEIEYWNKLLG